MQRQFRSIQGNPGAAKKKTAYFGRRECIIEKLFDFFLLSNDDRIFIVGAPVNPFLIFDVFDQIAGQFRGFLGRLDILCAFRVSGAKAVDKGCESEMGDPAKDAGIAASGAE